MLARFIFALILFVIPAAIKALDAPIEFVIVIPSYNNEKWCIKNLDSVCSQTYPHWSIIYINDCSQDKTQELVTKYIKDHKLESKITLINRKERKGAMANYYKGCMLAPARKVVATLDGDDRLSHPKVLLKLAKIYADKKVWATHGNYTSEPFTRDSYCTAYPEKVQKTNSFRKARWMGCQLRTFYAKLFHMIKKEDLMYGGEFLSMTSDLAFMFPILEMASKGHIYFVDEPIYIVNTANPISDVRKNKELQDKLNRHVRSLTPYKPLDVLFPY